MTGRADGFRAARGRSPGGMQVSGGAYWGLSGEWDGQECDARHIVLPEFGRERCSGSSSDNKVAIFFVICVTKTEVVAGWGRVRPARGGGCAGRRSCAKAG